MSVERGATSALSKLGKWCTLKHGQFHTPNGIHMRSLKPRTSTLALQKEIEAVGIQDIRSHEFKYAF